MATESLQSTNKLLQRKRDRAQAKIVRDTPISKLGNMALGIVVHEDPHTRTTKPRVEQEIFNLSDLVKVARVILKSFPDKHKQLKSA